jgi:2-polyprenyl-3-methyl-5-hydroxy-6-metoxy-1,4-benzoquinol methylase
MVASLFNQEYFTKRKYTFKEKLVKQHVFEVVKWASKALGINFVDGKGKRALDVGCAYGYTTEVLSTLGYETYGLDVSICGVKQADVINSGHFLVCDAQEGLPFKPGSFDLVTCFDVLEHLQFPERALQNMFDACSCLLLCTTPNKIVEKPVRKLTRDFDETHISVKSSSEWKKAINANIDYELLRIETFYDLTVNRAGKLFFKSVSLPYLGLTIRIAIKK